MKVGWRESPGERVSCGQEEEDGEGSPQGAKPLPDLTLPAFSALLPSGKLAKAVICREMNYLPTPQLESAITKNKLTTQVLGSRVGGRGVFS